MAAVTLIELQARRDALQKAIDSGALAVRQGESGVTYRSLKEMLDALAALEARIASYSTGTKTRVLRVMTRDGY